MELKCVGMGDSWYKLGDRHHRVSTSCSANSQWCVGALLSFNFHLSSLSPATTIFSIKLLLNQTHSIVSPRDTGGEAKRESLRTFTLLEEGKRPAEGNYFPDKRHPAIWRGRQAGGEREGGEITVERKCRMPNDNVARPSTLPGVVTPISVKHSMVLEVAFSVWGEDDLGNKMDIPTFGGLRLLRVSRPAVVPSVSRCGVEVSGPGRDLVLDH